MSLELDLFNSFSIPEHQSRGRKLKKIRSANDSLLRSRRFHCDLLTNAGGSKTKRASPKKGVRLAPSLTRGGLI